MFLPSLQKTHEVAPGKEIHFNDLLPRRFRFGAKMEETVATLDWAMPPLGDDKDKESWLYPDSSGIICS
jgi:hypothetical protein